jgi:hypothetical protein
MLIYNSMVSCFNLSEIYFAKDSVKVRESSNKYQVLNNLQLSKGLELYEIAGNRGIDFRAEIFLH